MFRRTFASLIAGSSFMSGQVTTGNTGNGSTVFNPQRPLSFEDVKKFLELTDAQMEQLRKLFDEQTSAVQGNVANIEAKRAELDNLLRRGSRDVSRIGQLTIDLYLLVNQSPAPVQEWRQRSLDLLTPQQRAKLPSLDQATRLAAAAAQAVALNLIDPAGPPVSPLSPMPLLPDPLP